MPEGVTWGPIGTFIGGCLGALLTLIGQLWLSWLRRPRLQLYASKPGCRIEAGNNKHYYVRILVENEGKSEAADAQAVITVNVRGPEVLSLIWSHEEYKTNLPSWVKRYVDICYTTVENDGVKCRIASKKYAEPLAVGSHVFDIAVAAKGAKTVHARVRVDFDGSYEGIQIYKLPFMWNGLSK